MLQEIKKQAMISVEYMIGLAVGLYVMIALVPGVLSTFFNASTAGWDATTKTLWGIVPLIIVVVIILVLYRGK